MEHRSSGRSTDKSLGTVIMAFAALPLGCCSVVGKFGIVRS
jgi:hypothetical protein